MTTREKINDYLQGFGGEALLLEPEMFDEAILGITERGDGTEVVAYDRQLVIEILMREGMEREEAEEYYSFNVVGSWLGDGTPIFVDTRFAE